MVNKSLFFEHPWATIFFESLMLGKGRLA